MRSVRKLGLSILVGGLISSCSGSSELNSHQVNELYDNHSKGLCIALSEKYRLENGNPLAQDISPSEAANNVLEYIINYGVPSAKKGIGAGYRKPGEIAPKKYSEEVVRLVEIGSQNRATIEVVEQDDLHCGGTVYKIVPKKEQILHSSKSKLQFIQLSS